MINNALSALKQVTNPLGNPVIGESLASDGKVASRDLADVRSLTGQSVTQAPPLTIPAWQVAALNQRAERRRSTPLQTFINGANEGNPVAVTLAGEEIRKQYDPMRDGFANQIQNPDFSRIDASRENLDQIRAGAPGIPSQAELQRPSENQMIAAGLAALVNPRQAFQSLSVPLNYGVYEQGQRQGLLNQENALEQQRYQEALRQANAELGLEGDAFTANQRAAEGAFGSIANLDRQAMADANDFQQTMYTQGELNQRADRANSTRLLNTTLQGANSIARQQLVNSGRMTALEYQSVEAEAMRLFNSPFIQERIMAGQITQEQAYDIVLGEALKPYYGNQNTLARTENTQANTAYTEARTETLRAMLQFVPEMERAKIAKAWADANRILQSGANDPQSRSLLSDAFQSAKYLQSNAEAEVKKLTDERDAIQKRMSEATQFGEAIPPDERGRMIVRLKTLGIAIANAQAAAHEATGMAEDASRALANRGTSGGVTSGGSFRPVPELGAGVTTGRYLLGGRFPMNLDQPYVYGRVCEDNGTDCGGFIAYAVRNAVGGDKNFPQIGSSTQQEYIKKNLGTKYTEISAAGFRPGTLQVGDIIFTRSGNSPSGRHVVMVSGFNNGTPIYVGAQGTRSGVRTATQLPGSILGIYRLNA